MSLTIPGNRCVMRSTTQVAIQASEQLVPALPPWFGEVVVIAHRLRHLGVLATIEERMHFARRRFGHYDLIDFMVVLLGYAISGERTLEAFYESVQPFAAPFMALFGRERLPHHSTLSRFLAALNQAAVEAWRTVFLEDLLARPLEQENTTGGAWDRQGNQWLVFDVDGTSCMQYYKPKGRLYRCPARGFTTHRDGVGCANLLSQHYTGEAGHILPPKEKYRHVSTPGQA